MAGLVGQIEDKALTNLWTGNHSSNKNVSTCNGSVAPVSVNSYVVGGYRSKHLKFSEVREAMYWQPFHRSRTGGSEEDT